MEAWKKHARIEVEDQSRLHRKRSQSASARLVEGKTCLRAHPIHSYTTRMETRTGGWGSGEINEGKTGKARCAGDGTKPMDRGGFVDLTDASLVFVQVPEEGI